jgi:hypothetical protein
VKNHEKQKHFLSLQKNYEPGEQSFFREPGPILHFVGRAAAFA